MGAAMAPNGFDQGEIAGLPGNPLAFRAIAKPDDLADPLAERAALALELAEPLGVGRRDILPNALNRIAFDGHGVTIDAGPTGPQAAEVGRRGRRHIGLGKHRGWRQQREAEHEGR